MLDLETSAEIVGVVEDDRSFFQSPLVGIWAGLAFILPLAATSNRLYKLTLRHHYADFSVVVAGERRGPEGSVADVRPRDQTGRRRLCDA